MVKDLGISTGVDMNKVVDIAFWISSVLGRKPASRVATALGAKTAKKPSAEMVLSRVYLCVCVGVSWSCVPPAFLLRSSWHWSQVQLLIITHRSLIPLRVPVECRCLNNIGNLYLFVFIVNYILSIIYIHLLLII